MNLYIYWLDRVIWTTSILCSRRYICTSSRSKLSFLLVVSLLSNNSRHQIQLSLLAFFFLAVKCFYNKSCIIISTEVRVGVWGIRIENEIIEPSSNFSWGCLSLVSINKGINLLLSRGKDCLSYATMLNNESVGGYMFRQPTFS